MSNNRKLNEINKIVNDILSLESSYSSMSDDELKGKTAEFKQRISSGESLDSILPEAFATVREASWRVLGMKHFPVQLMGGVALHQGKIAEMKTGEGKANPIDTPIPTPDGWKTVGDIKVGDYLFDRHGKPTKVLGVYPQGVIDTYEVTLRDGRKIKCAGEHLWSVYENASHKMELKTLTTYELLENITKAKRGYYYSLPINEPVEYASKDLELDPYVLGCFLGDGCRTVCANNESALTISSVDEEIVKNIATIIKASGYTKNKANCNWFFYNGVYTREECPTVVGKNKRILTSQVSKKYSDLLGRTYCWEKYIPEEYKLGSIEQRWSLIQGLMDTDGNIDTSISKKENRSSPRYSLTFSTTSEKLRDDFMEVIYSLGCSCSVYMHRKAGEHNAKHNQYEIRINVPNSIKDKFFRLSRKKDSAIEAKKINKKKDYSRISISNICKLEEQTEQVCFEVDNPEHLFLIGKYVVTHNTIVSTCPAYLNALSGNGGVFVVTVNDYLAKRDSQQMGKVYNFLGLSTGLITHEMSPFERKLAYMQDIVYITNNELGFDYLRDRMAYSLDGMVQKDLNYCIVDEIDSILIDEARTPLIISGFNGESDEGYKLANDFVRNLRGKKVVEKDNNKLEQMSNQMLGKEMVDEYADFDYIVEEKKKTVMLTDRGIARAEKYYGVSNLSDSENVSINHYITRSLKAYGLFNRDIDYVVKDGKVVIVDESTGRLMDGRRYSDGIHQAIEAKEGVDIQKESKTLASITFQNLFRKFAKLSGMTGTAMTEEEEFKEIYSLEVIQIPTNKPVIRIDKPDKVYITRKAKLNAIVNRVKECHEKGQPILVGTVSVEKSEELSKLLDKEGIKHTVLNAKYHEKEAQIVAQAGKYGAVTIATNMAGRGTDIILGGNPEYLALEELQKEGYSEELIVEANSYESTDNEEILNIRKLFKEKEKEIKNQLAPEVEKVKSVGGLYILGSERHESRRIDNQLRGRSGRQGDAGVSEFMLSLEDDLMRLFGSHKLVDMCKMMKIPEDKAIDMGILSNSVEKAQHRIEGQYFTMRKNTLEYDNVLAKQRDLIYDERQKIVLNEVDYKEIDLKMMTDAVENIINRLIESTKPLTSEEIDKVISGFNRIDGCFDLNKYVDGTLSRVSKVDMINDITEQMKKNFAALCDTTTEEYLNHFSHKLLLFLIDNSWQDHMVSMDELKKGIGLRAYAQSDPLQIYKIEGLELFDEMLENIREEVLWTFMSIYVAKVVNVVKVKESSEEVSSYKEDIAVNSEDK